MSSMACSIFCPGLTQSVLFALLFRYKWFHINYPIDLHWEPGWNCQEIHMHECFKGDYILLFDKYKSIYGMMYEYIHTYGHHLCSTCNCILKADHLSLHQILRQGKRFFCVLVCCTGIAHSVFSRAARKQIVKIRLESKIVHSELHFLRLKLLKYY